MIWNPQRPACPLEPPKGARFGKDFKVSEGEDPNAGGASGNALDVDQRLRAAALQSYYGRQSGTPKKAE